MHGLYTGAGQRLQRHDPKGFCSGNRVDSRVLPQYTCLPLCACQTPHHRAIGGRQTQMSGEGAVAEWLCRGLQSPVSRFDSGPCLQIIHRRQHRYFEPGTVAGALPQLPIKGLETLAMLRTV